MRVFPNMVVLAPGDGPELAKMLDFAIASDAPVAIRYPKASAKDLGLGEQPIELGKSQVLRWGTDLSLIHI